MKRFIDITKLSVKRLERMLDWYVEYAESKPKRSKVRKEYLGYAERARKQLHVKLGW